MKRKKLWSIVGAASLATTALGAAAYRMIGEPLYTVGEAAARLATTQPLPEAADPQAPWPVGDGIELYHFEAGAGTPALVVSGGPCASPQAPWRAAAALDGDVQLSFYHPRGCGRSTHPIDRPHAGSTYRQMQEVERALGLGAQIADIERIRQLQGRDKLTLVGHSFGALVAALYAAEFPDHVAALIFVAPANLLAAPSDGADLFALVRARLPAAMVGAFDAYMAEYFDFPSLMTKNEQELTAFFARFAPFYAAAAGMPELARPASPTDAGGWMPLASYLSLGQRRDFRPALAGVQVPVLVIHGADDMIPAAESEAFASAFPHATTVAIPGAKHFPFDEQPAAFARAVAAFLR
jgi:proline iminopeptidase